MDWKSEDDDDDDSDDDEGGFPGWVRKGGFLRQCLRAPQYTQLTPREFGAGNLIVPLVQVPATASSEHQHQMLAGFELYLCTVKGARKRTKTLTTSCHGRRTG
jgi:hypothetical protein